MPSQPNVEFAWPLRLSYDFGMETQPITTWKYLEPKPGSRYRQLFVKGRNLAASTLYSCYAREEDPMTPEQIAEDRNLPLEVVLEAIAYSEGNPAEFQRDYDLDTATMEARGMLSPDYRGKPKMLTSEEQAEMRRRFP